MNTIKDEALLAHVTELLNSTRAVRDAFHIQGSSYRSWFPSRKGFDGPIPAESGLAADALRLLDLAPEVVMIVTSSQLTERSKLEISGFIDLLPTNRAV